MKNLILLLILMTCCIPALLAQTPLAGLNGTIIDQASEAPIPFATVLVLNTDPPIGTTSDEKGKFKLEGLPVGRYDLQISFLGYEPRVFNGVLLSSGKRQNLNISLKESTIDLEAVVVRPKKEKERALNKMATVSAQQLSMEEANKYAGGFDDPARLVASFAGVASDITSNGIVIRGNAPKGLLWRIEGIEVPNPNHFAEIDGFGGGGITALSSRMLANSDFFTGAFPAEYGNGLSGVFDLSIRNGNADKAEHALQAGFLGLDVASEGPFAKGKNASYLFNYRYSTFGLIDVFLPEEDGLGIAYQDLSFKLHFPSAKRGTFSLWGLGLIDRASSQPDRDTSVVWNYYEDLESEESKISMGVFGLSHKYFFKNKAYVKTIFSASGNNLSSQNSILDSSFENEIPVNDIRYNTLNFKFSSLLNYKFNARHTNRSGLIISRLGYTINLKETSPPDVALNNLVDEKGESYLFQAYSQSTIALGKEWALHPGLHFQYFKLTNKYTIEPRLGIRWQMNDRQSLNLGYGLHSQLEKLNFYLSKVSTANGFSQLNKDLDFSKAHHLVLSFDRMLGRNTHLRIEPYAQLLYHVPVVADSSFSFINLEDDFFINGNLINTGRGRNLGVDFTLERFLADGWYYLLTASIFDSQYQGGDGIWRDTRFNKQYLSNILVGKEWTIGQKNLLNVSAKFSFAGGNRFHPIDEKTSLARKEIVEDLSRPFAEQEPNAYRLHLTCTYRINKKKRSSLWSLQLLNVLADKEYYGYRYNFRTQSIDLNTDAIIIPNLSYKIEF